MSPNGRSISAFFSLCLGAICTLALVSLLRAPAVASPSPSPDPLTRYVATTGTDTGDCRDPGNPCHTIQYAVDQAGHGDEVRIATGTYTGVHVYPRDDFVGSGVVTQAIYISRTVAIRGGFTTTNGFAGPSDPVANQTIVDAEGSGRVIYVARACSPTIDGLLITGGSDAGQGGGAYDYDAGGGIYVAGAATLKNSQILSNTARVGGGVYVAGSASATIAANTIAWNVVDGSGGGVYLRTSGPDVSVSSNLICHNTAEQGGGLHLKWGSPSVSGNRIISNVATWAGGGLFVSSSSAHISDNLVSENRATRGGGLILYEPASPLIDSTSVISNHATEGGGVRVSGGCSGSLRNVIVANNEALVDGAGLYVRGSSVRMLHTTVAGNRIDGGAGIHVAEGTAARTSLALTNTVLADQNVAISVTGESTVTLNGVLWDTSTPITVSQSASATVVAHDQYTGDPAFVDPSTGDYHIRLASAALDRGLPTAANHDIDGDPRPLGAAPDLGADEVGMIVSKRVSHPFVRPGDTLTYTITLTNATPSPLHALVVDTLPEHVTPASVPFWLPTLPPSHGLWSTTFTVTAGHAYQGPLANTVQVVTAEGPSGTAQATSTVEPCTVYLPLTVRAF